MIRATARVTFAVTLAAVAFATLAPIAFRPESGLSPQKERFAAFMVLGLLAALGWPRRRIWAVAVLAGVAGLLEAAQALAPGRHGRLFDFEAKAMGAIAGGVLALLAEPLLRRWRGADD